ncbi:MAG TPA: zf-HC2 domain-containing protein [Gemmatimonadaceae bacterium]|nr:zf-HC2 domain-containing protein [Gemmatimonadaceae bacterium]
MITEHPDIETLSALADRELTGASLLRAERHVAECASCRDTLDRVRALVHAAAALPRDVAPPPELWEGIRKGIHPRPRRWAWAMASLAAAAVLVLAVGTLLPRPGRSGKVRAPVAAATTPAVLVSVDRNYAAPIAELRLTLEQQRHTLSPATVRIVERSIAVIDAAIAEARAALAADPANEFIADVLSAQYQQKLDLLQRATKMSPST